MYPSDTHVVVDAATVESLHASLGRTRVVVLNKPVVEALHSAHQPWIEKIIGQSAKEGRGWDDSAKSQHEVTYSGSAGGLVRDNLNTLDVASRLEDLAQNVLSDSGIESTNVQGPLVRLRRGAARGVGGASGARRRHDASRHGRADGGRDGVRVLRDDNGGERRRRHVLLGVALLAIVARRAGGGRWGRQAGARGCGVGHGWWEQKRQWNKWLKADCDSLFLHCRLDDGAT